MKVSISLAQMNLASADVKYNLARALGWIHEAARRGSHLILLPELWSTAYDLSHGMTHSQTNITICEQLARLSQQLGISIGGSLLEARDGKLYNTFTIIQPDRPPTSYSKIHLFRLMDEDKWLQSGEQLAFVDFPWGKAGLAVCYDLRFPEMFRRYAIQGAQIILLVAEWALPRVRHFQLLQRARAIENQVFVATVNAVGLIGTEVFGGSSAITDPWGETLVDGGEKEEVLLTAEIDLGRVDEIRQKLPFFADRNPVVDL